MADVNYHYKKSRAKHVVAAVVIILAAAVLAWQYLPGSSYQVASNAQPDAPAAESPAAAPSEPAAPGGESSGSGLGGVATVERAHGLAADYYSGSTTLAGTPVTGTVNGVDLAWSSDNPPAPNVTWSRFSARFSGKLVIDRAGEYLFVIKSDDGSRLAIDGKTIADIWGATGIKSKSAYVVLSEGEHDLRIDYRNIGGGAALVKLEYKSDPLNLTRQVIPGEKLFVS